MSPQRYLADTAAAAEAVNDFLAELRGVGTIARRAALVRVAPALEEPLARTQAIAERLEAERLEDRRLEDQRAAAADALAAVVAAMERVTAAAQAGDPDAAEAAAADLADAVGELRTVAEPS